MSFRFSVYLTALLFSLSAFGSSENNIVLSTKRIVFEKFPDAFNPSIIKVEEGYLLVFRYCPNRHAHPWLSYIGIALLDETFIPISDPQLLKIRPPNSKIISQAEDPRLFSHKGRIFLIYNDNDEKASPSTADRRDIFIAELFCTDGYYSTSSPRKLIYEEKNDILWQKNWVPFEYKDMLLLAYSLNPHEILSLNFINGSCYRLHKTEMEIEWNWGTLRGSSSPIQEDGEYIGFFHSGIMASSPSSWGYDLWHYYMGAYTFSADPPFQITKISPSPIIGDGFYTPSSYYKRVIFPGGYVISGSTIYVAYGKDDCEMWIATLDKAALKRSLIPVKPI